MRRSAAYALALLALGLILAFRLGPDLKKWLQAPPAAPAPVAAPVTAPASPSVEGPYFSDGGQVAERIVAAINHTREKLDVAMYDLTEPNIAGALEAARRRGVQVRIVSDEGQSRESHSEISYLSSRGIPVRLSRGYNGDRSLMHDKFAVFDRKFVVTGSFNWTTSAERYNFENAIFVSDPGVVGRYESEFERIWSQAR